MFTFFIYVFQTLFEHIFQLFKICFVLILNFKRLLLKVMSSFETYVHMRENFFKKRINFLEFFLRNICYADHKASFFQIQGLRVAPWMKYGLGDTRADCSLFDFLQQIQTFDFFHATHVGSYETGENLMILSLFPILNGDFLGKAVVSCRISLFHNNFDKILTLEGFLANNRHKL